jgi:hypothetical protein
VLHLYKLLLLLYPWAHRQEFAEEMLSVFREVHRDCASLGFKARVRFSLREIAGLLAGVFREHAKVRKASLTGGTMRMFRFPRWTVTLLVFALGIVIAGNRIIAGITWDTLSSGVSISPRWALLLPLLLAAALFVCVLGVIVFVLRAALGRTCIQRWSALKTWPAQGCTPGIKRP